VTHVNSTVHNSSGSPVSTNLQCKAG
jgi:hypothetical protein